MKEKRLKVLIISAEVWKDDTNGGNVLSNIFLNVNWDFAQIYCNPGIPENNICKKYYQMTDSMILKNYIFHRPIGKQFELLENTNDIKIEKKVDMPSRSFYSFFHKHRLMIFYCIKYLLWNTSNWKNRYLQKFLDDFQPDIIFAPCYGDIFMLRLTRYVQDYTKKNTISYISDDHYTLKQFNLSPLFWLNRFFIRNQLRKTFPYYSLVYTMTDEQKIQCEKDFNANMKILRKSISFFNNESKYKTVFPIRMVYAGGIYLNRWKTLEILAKAIKEINNEFKEKKILLDIYTPNEVTNRMKRYLDDGINSQIHSAITKSQLGLVYKRSDIALHVESKDLKNRLLVRMSFSTKIVDCLSSGCAVMAITDEKQSGFKYLQTNDAAICVSDKKQIKSILKSIIADPKIINKYKISAIKCCKINHNISKNNYQIKSDFELYKNKTNY